MIRFSLSCSEGHGFDGWFASSDAFDTQKAERAIPCPMCGDLDVDKALMTPAVAGSAKKDAVPLAAHPPAGAEPEIVKMMRKLRNHLTANADYVGARFPEEARRIHYEEVERRGIYGEATTEEARSLAEEGIEFHPLPVLPEDHN